MTTARTLPLAAALAAALALSACGEEGPVDSDLNQTEAASEMINSTGDAEPATSVDGSAPVNEAATAPAAPGALPAPASAIPTALQGRWGMTPGDCTSTRGDNKGLLTISADRLRFYESRAVPSAKIETSPDSIRGDFAFEGEGQAWTRYQALEIQDDKLLRTERDPNASYSYVRCD